MIEIVTDEHYSLITLLFEDSTDNIKIISPFLSRKMAELLCEAAHKGVECSFITRFYLQDFIDGSNTLDGLQNMLDAGVKLYALIGLHTKLYLYDGGNAIVGSANFTEGGLVRNVELSVHLADEPAIDTLQEYYDDIVSKVENAEDGIITQNMLDDYKNRYRKFKESSSQLGGGTKVVAVVRGAALDRIARNLKENSGEVFDEIEANTQERLSDPVYVALGGKKEAATHKALRNIILKFSASAKRRANGNEPMNLRPFIDDGKTVYITNFSEAKKNSAKTVEEGDETFFCVHSYDKDGKNCPLIVGKGFLRKYNSNNDARDKGWVTDDSSLDEYPIYCVISEAKIIKAPINCGIPLRELTDTLGYKTYVHTRKKPIEYPSDRVAKAHGQQAMLALTADAKEYLDKRLEELGSQYGWINYKSE